jgi:hypothetical protein
MKKVRVTFDYDGYIIVSSGVVWDSLYVDELYYDIKDHNDDTVFLDKETNKDIRELAEELILEKYNDLELFM